MAVSYDYQKIYGMVMYDWMETVLRWIGVQEEVVKVIKTLMEGCKARLELQDNGNFR